MLKAHGVGRFVKDPELKEVGDTCLCEFSLAFNEFRKVQGESKKVAHFFDFVIWDKGAEMITQYCKKGDQIEVALSPRQEKWEAADGTGRSKVVFRVDRFEFISNRGRSNDESTTNEEEAAF